MSEMKAINPSVIAEFRANGGELGGMFAGLRLLLLTTTGARSGRAHTTPLAYATDGDRLVVVASNGGAPAHPDWYHNLVARSEATVELGPETFQMRAVVPDRPERDRLFDQMAALIPDFAEYQRNVTRLIPVVVLERGGEPISARG